MKTQKKTTRSTPFPIAAFGASAGGLEAFIAILRRLKPDSGMAFFYIQHQDPTHRSGLPDILSRSTSMKVETGRNKAKVEPNHIYINPPNSTMTIENGILRIQDFSGRGPHLPIDSFFRSLAAERGRQAIAVVLSGTASDGTLGIKEIK